MKIVIKIIKFIATVTIKSMLNPKPRATTFEMPKTAHIAKLKNATTSNTKSTMLDIFKLFIPVHLRAFNLLTSSH